MIHANALAAKVAAVNSANRYANELLPRLVEALAPFMGHKILKADGTLLQKVKEALPAFPNTVPLSVYRNSSDYSLAWVVKTCESIAPYGCTYHETTLYVGKLDGAILKEWNGANNAPFRTDYTAEEVTRLRKVAEDAKRAASAAESALYPFGMYDR